MNLHFNSPPFILMSEQLFEHCDFTLQDILPRLPIPKMEKTCSRYLASQRPLLTEEEFANTEKVVAEFLKEDFPRKYVQIVHPQFRGEGVASNFSLSAGMDLLAVLAIWHSLNLHRLRIKSVQLHCLIIVCSLSFSQQTGICS